MSAAGTRRHVLLTASGFESPERLGALASVVRETSHELFWWVRMHPCRLEKAAEFEAALRTSGASTWDVAHATQLPLYALLRFMDVHVTEASSTLLEAAAMGVPSVLLSRANADLFSDEIRDGWAYTVDGPSEVPSGIRRQLDRRDRLRARSPRDADVAGGFDAMLAKVADRASS